MGFIYLILTEILYLVISYFFPDIALASSPVISIFVMLFVIGVVRKKYPSIDKIGRIETSIEKQIKDEKMKYGECPKCGAPKAAINLKTCPYCHYDFINPQSNRGVQ